MTAYWLKSGGVMHVAGEYKAGDPPPAGYNDWHDWAAVQHKAGLRQSRCRVCGLWRFPQEMADGVCCATKAKI